MRNDTRLLFNSYAGQLAKLNGVPSALDKFTVSPTVQQTLEAKIQESDAFLQLINFVPVDEMAGQKVGLGVGSSIAGRTNTDEKDRTPKGVGSTSANNYLLSKTEYDTYIKYSQIDAWAKFPDFQTKLRDMVNRQIGLDRIKIGFFGTSAAAETNLTTNPQLQDVNIGWLQQYRTNAADRVMTEVKADSGVIKVGASVAAADGYKNLAALVFDAINNLIHPAYRGDPRIRVMLSPELRAAYMLSLLNRDQVPSEMSAAEQIVRQSSVGLNESITPPFMPEGTILITMPENLSLYYQTGSVRRQLKDKPERDRIEDYRSQNEGFVVEQYEAGCLLENVTLVP